MNVFILFQPGCGGNHLADLIATDPQFNFRLHKDTYINMHKQEDPITHVKSRYIPGQTLECGYNLNHKNVLPFHLGIYIQWREGYGGELCKKKPLQIVSIKNDISFNKRHIFPRMLTYTDEYLYGEQCEIYKKQNLRTFLSDRTIYDVPLSEFMSADIKNFMKQYFPQFHCDLDLCEWAHTLWRKSLKLN